ncbi:hypothetical protein Aduo_014979 [Ancylostoma duodenale]
MISLTTLIACSRFQKYTCDLENLAYELVRSTGPVAQIGGVEITYDTGIRFNVDKVVESWRKTLEEMSEKKEFGCNLSINDKYKVACVFK